MTTPWQLDLLWGVLVGGATGAVGVPLAAVVANRWFSTRRGLVTGILTASNENLVVGTRQGRFREDLYHRLAVITVGLPPLRERGDDIILLAQHFLSGACADYKLPPRALSPGAAAALLAYHWPGNVRELANVIERGVILSQGSVLELGEWRAKGPTPASGQIPTLEELEQQHIISVLDRTGWRVSGEKGAANLLGLKPTTLEARMKKLGIARKAS